MSNSNLTRRGLLRNGAATGAGLALPTIFTSSAHAYTNEPTGDTVTLGFNVPQTGPYAEEGLDELRATLRSMVGATAASDPDAALRVRIGLPENDRSFRAACRERGIWPDDRLGEEGYALLVEPDQILLAAYSATGVYYGIQTLRAVENFLISGIDLYDFPVLIASLAMVKPACARASAMRASATWRRRRSLTT